jgi:hypothetical protein
MSLGYHHRLGDNKGNARPTHVIFFDVESRVSKPKQGKRYFTPFLWTSIYKHYDTYSTGRKAVQSWGTDPDTFWDWVSKHIYPKSKTYLVSHNIVVDFIPMQGFMILPAMGWKFTKLIWRQRVVIMTWEKDTSKLIIMNNGNLFDGSISEWGKVFGVEKLSMPDDKAPMSEWLPYCMRDTEIVVMMWDNLLGFLDTHDLGNFQLTKASLALTAYKHRFTDTPISIHKDEQVITHERNSYHGGRFEAFQVGNFTEGDYYNLDITSMYGWIESKYPVPYELRGYADSCDMATLKYALDKYAVIAQVDLDLAEPIIPIKENGKVSFPTGLVTGVLCSPELSYCLEKGYIKDVSAISWYYQEPVLKRYADYFLGIKQQYEDEGNKPMRQLSKLYLNSLYGKFAQHGFIDDIIGECDPGEYQIIYNYDVSTDSYSQLCHYCGQIHQVTETPIAYNSMVALASHITAYGRMYLWQLIKCAGLENVYHVATDSLVVNDLGYQNLSPYVKPGMPGYLKLEGISKGLTIKDVNDTIFDGKVKIKGIPKTAIQIGENDYQLETWPSMTSLIRKGEQDQYYINVIKKHLKRPRYMAALNPPLI